MSAVKIKTTDGGDAWIAPGCVISVVPGEGRVAYVTHSSTGAATTTAVAHTAAEATAILGLKNGPALVERAN